MHDPAGYGALMDLRIDPDELASCVSCGLCLPHCPTFRVTGEEALSPRGRIAAMRSVQVDGAPVTGEFVEFVETPGQLQQHYGKDSPMFRVEPGDDEALEFTRVVAQPPVIAV